MNYRDLPFKDGIEDLEPFFLDIFDMVYELRPRLSVELGVRSGNSTRVIASAIRAAESGMMVSFDPQPFFAFPAGKEWREVAIIHTFYSMTGEEAFALWPRRLLVDFMFIDTDPHEYKQTLGWLKTWVKRQLAPRGLAVFHDTELKPGVKEAIESFMYTGQAALGLVWDFHITYDSRGQGLGILRRKGRRVGE